METIEIYRTMARYNRWMNERLGDVCETLTDAERKADRGAPFRSIHGLWNHLLLTDRVWLSRFHGTSFPITGLDQELYSDFAQLRRERAHTDSEIDAFVESLSDEKLAETLHYTSISNPQPRAYPLYIVTQHLFNHQAHHRGQMTTLLEQMGVDFGLTDLIGLPSVQR